MLERPLKLDQLCKTPIPHMALTDSSEMTFPSRTIVLPPIGQDDGTSTATGYNPRSERELRGTTGVEQVQHETSKEDESGKEESENQEGAEGQVEAEGGGCETRRNK